MPIEPISHIGPFTLLERLGTGGMAETFVARAEAADSDDVCLKVIRSDLRHDRRIVALFREEARLHCALRHPNIVQAVDAGSDQGRDYMVLELVRGVPLVQLMDHARLSRSPLPIPVAAYILRSVCAALAYAHDFELRGVPQKIVHRDVSPSNILVSTSGVVKLSDFGIAKASDRIYATTAGIVRGKLAYMAPEQIEGGDVGHGSDLFALGIIAYQLLANHHPFAPGPGVPDVAIPHRILTGQRELVAIAAPGLPAYLVDLIESMLAHEPRSRPESAAAIATCLTDLEGETGAMRELKRRVRACSSSALRGFTPAALERSEKSVRRRVAPMPGTTQAWPAVPLSPTSPTTSVLPLYGASKPYEKGNPLTLPVFDAANPASEADSTRLAISYVSKLPRGLASYAGCMAKGSLMNAFLASKPIDPAGVPTTLQALFARPPRTNTWIPEVHFLTLALLIREQHFTADEPFLSWVKDVNAQLFKGPIYRALMLVASTRMLAAGTPLRWRQFHQGTQLVAYHGDGSWVDLRFHYEPNLFSELHVRLFLASLEAAITAVGESGCRTVSVEASVSEARARIEWSQGVQT